MARVTKKELQEQLKNTEQLLRIAEADRDKLYQELQEMTKRYNDCALLNTQQATCLQQVCEAMGIPLIEINQIPEYAKGIHKLNKGRTELLITLRNIKAIVQSALEKTL